MANTHESRTEPQPTAKSKNSYSDSIAAGIRQFVQQNPQSSTKLTCAALNLDYQRYGQYVRNQRSLLKRNKYNKLQHDSHRNLYVWNLPQLNDLKEKIQISPRGFGWNCHAKNKLLFLHDDALGSVLWHNTNRIELYLKGKPLVGRAKTLFCKAFFSDQLVPDIREIDKIFNKGRIEGKHHVFLIGKQVPRFQIDYFASSHGLTILNDKSHEESIEVVENKPFWLDDLQKIGADFKENMAKHMQLLDAMNRKQRQIDMRIGENLIVHVKKFLLRLINYFKQAQERTRVS
jgi:hypothetical protein